MNLSLQGSSVKHMGALVTQLDLDPGCAMDVQWVHNGVCNEYTQVCNRCAMGCAVGTQWVCNGCATSVQWSNSQVPAQVGVGLPSLSDFKNLPLTDLNLRCHKEKFKRAWGEGNYVCCNRDLHHPQEETSYEWDLYMGHWPWLSLRSLGREEEDFPLQGP